MTVQGPPVQVYPVVVWRCIQAGDGGLSVVMGLGKPRLMLLVASWGILESMAMILWNFPGKKVCMIIQYTEIRSSIDNCIYMYSFSASVMAIICNFLPTSNYDTSLPILLDDVSCSSSTNFLLLCSHRGIGVENCDHSQDIKLYCTRLSSKLIIVEV